MIASQESLRACSGNVPPWVENPYRLVSLGEILMDYAEDEVHFGPYANIFYSLGLLDDPKLTGFDVFGMAVLLEKTIADMERLGLRTSATHAQKLIDIITRKDPTTDVHGVITMLRTALHTELDTTLFLHVQSSDARYYREPRHDWDAVIARFGDTVSDVEEANRCLALGRYAAAVFHSTQVIEMGLIELGQFISIPDPKSGFTAVCNELKRILDKKYDALSDFERSNRSFFEQVYATAEALKNAWRNKISHAQGKLHVMTADFSPQVAQEILYASRAFMRRLAEDMPS